MFLELVKHVALRNRTQADILDLADGGLLLDVDMDDPALGRLFAFDSQIVEIAGVPQGIEVPFQGLLVIHVARLGEHAGTNGFRRNPAVAMDHDTFHHVLLRYAGPGE